VVRLSDEMLFFKNRDLSRAYLTYRTTIWHATPKAYALKGADLKTGTPCGVAIGVNRHKICVANTHVISTPDVTYDLLCEQLLSEVQERPDVPRVVGAFMDQHRVQGGRVLVAAPEWAYLVEVLGKQFEIQTVEGSFVITNSFSLLPDPEKSKPVRQQSSASRLQTARAALPHISSIGALKSMLRSHRPEKGELSICNHRQDGGGTESSHIIHIQGTYVSWSSLVGFPCESDYQAVQPFARL
jgi:hypothetical protein